MGGCEIVELVSSHQQLGNKDSGPATDGHEASNAQATLFIQHVKPSKFANPS